MNLLARLFDFKSGSKNKADQLTRLGELERQNHDLREKIRLNDGNWSLINGQRVYERDENQGQFEQKRHLNLGGICLQALKQNGLDAKRTARRDPRGDIEYSASGSVADKAKLKQAFAKLQSKYNPTK